MHGNQAAKRAAEVESETRRKEKRASSRRSGKNVGVEKQTSTFLKASLSHVVRIFPTLAPSAGPTGGAGLALPAGRASLMYPATGGRELKDRERKRERRTSATEKDKKNSRPICSLCSRRQRSLITPIFRCHDSRRSKASLSQRKRNGERRANQADLWRPSW